MWIPSVVSSMLASVATGSRGFKRAELSDRAQPQELLELYSFEGCPWCRLVRERLTELDLDYIHRSCPKGPSPNRDKLRSLGGVVQVPYLVDPNTQTAMYESAAIIAYLNRTYGA